MTQIDTSTEAVERMAKFIHASCGCAMGENAEQPVAGVLRDLLTERDRLMKERDDLRAKLIKVVQALVQVLDTRDAYNYARHEAACEAAHVTLAYIAITEIKGAAHE